MGATITEIYYNWYYFLPLYSVSEFFFLLSSIMLHRKHWAKLLVSSSVKTTFYGIFSSLWTADGISVTARIVRKLFKKITLYD